MALGREKGRRHADREDELQGEESHMGLGDSTAGRCPNWGQLLGVRLQSKRKVPEYLPGGNGSEYYGIPASCQVLDP